MVFLKVVVVSEILVTVIDVVATTITGPPPGRDLTYGLDSVSSS